MRALVLLTALVALSLIPAPPALGGASGSSFQWVAPVDHVGPLAVQVRFDFGEANRCVILTQAAGLRRDVPVLSWEEEDGSDGAFYSVYAAQAHFRTGALSVDSRALVGPGGAWSLTTTRSGTFSGVIPYTLVVANGASWSDPRTGDHAALRLEVTCDAPFTAGDFHKGYEAFGFTADSMRGGSGASVSHIAGRAMLVENDHARTHFTHSDVTMRLRATSAASVVSGTLRLEAPSGLQQWDLAQPQRVRYEDGAGAYDVMLDYRAVGLSGSLIGLLYGVDPVSTLDA